MHIERFVSHDLRHALRAVKTALGEDAIIVATRQLKRGGLFTRGKVEVLASRAEANAALAAPPVKAPVERLAPAPGAAAATATQAYAEQHRAAVHSVQQEQADRPNAASWRAALAPLEKELHALRESMVANTASQTSSAEQTPTRLQAQLHTEMGELKRLLAGVQLGGVSLAQAARAADRAILDAADVDPEVAEALLADLGEGMSHEPLAEVATRLKRGIAFALPTVGDFFRRGPARRIALVGPTGVGKTTTVAKIAAHAALRHDMRVALVSLDTYRIGAQQQLEEYAELVGVPMAMAHDRRSFAEALAKHADVDLLLIDTAGRAPDQATAHCLQLRQLFASHGVEVFVTLAAATRRMERQQMLAAMGELTSLGARALILTKLDEAVALGSCLSLTHQTGLPLAFVTSGQRVPEDLAVADGQMLAHRLVDAVLATQNAFSPVLPSVGARAPRQLAFAAARGAR